MYESNKINWDDQGHLEVLTFDIGDEKLAIEAVMIREILDLLPETRVPGAAPLVGSIVNFRGKIIPIADLRFVFGMPVEDVTADSRIVVIETELNGEPTHVGIRSDKVHEVATLSCAATAEPPAVGINWHREFVRAFVREADGLIVLPDLTAIFESASGINPTLS